MAKSKKGGMEYEEVELDTKDKTLGKKHAVTTAKQLRVSTLLSIVAGKVTATVGSVSWKVSKWLARFVAKFTVKHKFALVSIYAGFLTATQFLPFLPELVKSTIMGVL